MSSKRGRGRPPKVKRNISGLRNQKSRPLTPEPTHSQPSEEYSPDWPSDLIVESEDESEAEEFDLANEDGMKSKPGSDIDVDSDVEVEGEEKAFSLATEFLEDEVLLERLLSQAEKRGDDADEEEWVPPRVRYQRQRRKQEKKTRGKYKKGPDVGSKSLRTQRRYRKSIAIQTKLQAGSDFVKHPLISPDASAALDTSTVEMASLSDGAGMSGIEDQSPYIIDEDAHSEASAMSVDEQAINSAGSDSDSDSLPENALSPPLTEEEAMHEWELEAEYETLMFGAVPEIRDWNTLRDQIKQDLKKKAKTLTLAQFNQLTIIRNFATLHLKGLSRLAASREIALQWHEGEGFHFARQVRALARHYQRFEQLPVEKRGGLRASRSLLCDQTVKTAARDWLMAQKIGTVRPTLFQRALNDVILPALGIHPKTPLCERTARRWLVKLGFRRTVFRKGIYVGGHEREDVVKYRNEVFLPVMAEYEKRMIQYELRDGVLVGVRPTLAPGEKEIIAEFHDEASFHAFESLNSAWWV
ncbi:hypothetical protein K438DRAFT_1769019 [Mycena galopus ATCC 62051]|nr:hypothetical protein K438DRAFT_1769019 [Mycena galopus ATCC 62051]